jgi:hypothetical protein
VADDCLEGREEITRKWGALVRELYPVFRAICRAEAYDTGVYAPIWESMTALPRILERLQEIENYLEPYRDVVQEAIRKYEQEHKRD